MDNYSQLVSAVCFLFGSIFMLYFSYPSSLRALNSTMEHTTQQSVQSMSCTER